MSVLEKKVLYKWSVLVRELGEYQCLTLDVSDGFGFYWDVKEEDYPVHWRTDVMRSFEE